MRINPTMASARFAQMPTPCAPARPNRTVAGWNQLGTLQDPRLNEVSGVVASRTQPGVLWVHNDSGDTARIFGIGTDGVTRAEVQVAGAEARDWEDIAMGAGPDGRDWIYVADTGDNRRVRDSVQLYRFPEPAAAGAGRVVAERIDVTYPDGRSYDVEALMIDPRTGDALLVTKVWTGPVQLMRVPQAQLASGTARAELVAELPFGALVTGGDISRDGSSILIRNYDTAAVWRRGPAETIEQALVREPSKVDAPDESEAIAFTPDGQAWLSIPEGEGAPISRYDAALAT